MSSLTVTEATSPETITVQIDGITAVVPVGTSVAAAIMITDDMNTSSHKEIGNRTSVSGERRGAFCGMGICFECRVTINGNAHDRGCQIQCQNGMVITTS